VPLAEAYSHRSLDPISTHSRHCPFLRFPTGIWRIHFLEKVNYDGNQPLRQRTRRGRKSEVGHHLATAPDTISESTCRVRIQRLLASEPLARLSENSLLVDRARLASLRVSRTCPSIFRKEVLQSASVCQPEQLNPSSKWAVCRFRLYSRMVEDVCKGCGSDAERPAIYGKLKLTYFECISGLIIGTCKSAHHSSPRNVRLPPKTPTIGKLAPCKSGDQRCIQRQRCCLKQ
jgi:hypothetical protein